MKKIIIPFFFFIFLFSHEINQKLIVYGEENGTLVQEKFIKLQHYFKENTQANKLQNKHGFILEKEKIDGYNIVVVKPIYSRTVRNELLSIVNPFFPESFTIENRESQKMPLQKSAGDKKRQKEITKELLSFEERFGIRPEWLAILLLSCVGLGMSLWNRKKLSILKIDQKAFIREQKSMEVEIDQLGEENG